MTHRDHGKWLLINEFFFRDLLDEIQYLVFLLDSNTNKLYMKSNIEDADNLLMLTARSVFLLKMGVCQYEQKRFFV
jgi:hypothetical protein